MRCQFDGPSANILLRHHSPTFTIIRIRPGYIGIFQPIFIFTRSPPFATIRKVSVDRVVDYGTDDRAAYGTQGGKSEAARHVCRRRRALSPRHQGRREELGLPVHAEWPTA